MTAASSRVVRDRDLAIRPRWTPEDILLVVPGLVLAQHQGGGKADQIFLRGFDADHGTDVAISVDGVPVNLVSHAHGQGYADLHFLIPEVVERVEVVKGPYFAELGDFATAGAVNLVTRKKFDASQVTAAAGSFGTYRILGVASAETNALHPWFAAEIYGTQGPFRHHERLERANLFGKATYDLGPSSSVSVLASAYASSWTGSGQIPARLVDVGFLDRFGAVDPTEGGSTHREQLAIALQTKPDASSSFTASVAAVRYGLTLFNDFSFQARNPEQGDEIEQGDDRVMLYGQLKYERQDRVASVPGLLLTSMGAQVRHDSIRNSLYKVQQRRRVDACGGGPNPCIDTDVRQTSIGAYLQQDYRPARWLRLVAGLRSDLFEFNVQPRQPGRGILVGSDQPFPPTVQRSIVSPKFTAVVSPAPWLDLFANLGSGFHSNDARSAVTTGGSGALPRALGYEVGARARLLEERLELAAAAWLLDLQSELVWVGDDGVFAPSRATRRIGVDLEVRFQILPWLLADFDATFARPRYRTDDGNGTAVALAPRRTITAGLTAKHLSGFFASLRLRHVGPRPATTLTESDAPRCAPDNDASAGEPRCYLVADGYTVLDATVGFATRRFAVQLLVENLTDAHFREAQFATVSRVISPPDGNTVSTAGAPWVPEPHPILDVHYTPGKPIGALVSGTLYF
jgi:outer membrane receptor protein involved in Fe transport